MIVKTKIKTQIWKKYPYNIRKYWDEKTSPFCSAIVKKVYLPNGTATWGWDEGKVLWRKEWFWRRVSAGFKIFLVTTSRMFKAEFNVFQTFRKTFVHWKVLGEFFNRIAAGRLHHRKKLRRVAYFTAIIFGRSPTPLQIFGARSPTIFYKWIYSISIPCKKSYILNLSLYNIHFHYTDSSWVVQYTQATTPYSLACV